MENTSKITNKERFYYVLYFFGQCCAYILVTSFLQIYMTDIGISAITVGIIFLVAKVWDAINDPLFGVLVDKVTLKGGKYLPWLRLAVILVPVSTFLLFAIPNTFPLWIKITWASVGYVLWDTSYTICDVPIFAIVTSMTKNVKERGALLSYGRIGVALSAILLTVCIPLIYPIVGWMLCALIVGIFSFLFMFPITRHAKERYTERNQKTSVKGLLGDVLKNKYLVIFLGAYILGGIFNTASISSYFYIHAMGGPQIISLISTVLILPILLGTLLTPTMVKYFDKAKFAIACYGVTILISIVIYISGYHNFWLYVGLAALKTLFTTFAGNMAIMFTADCAEYGLFKTGRHAEGITFSMQTFAVKFVSAVSGALGMIFLGIVGFVEGTGVVQSQGTIDWMWVLITIVPAISSLVTFLILLFGYKLRDKDVQIMSQVNQGKLSREEAGGLLSRKY